MIYTPSQCRIAPETSTDKFFDVSVPRVSESNDAWAQGSREQLRSIVLYLRNIWPVRYWADALR